MKLIKLLISLTTVLGTFVEAALAKADPEKAAYRQIREWTKKYQDVIYAELKHRKSGCTKEKLIHRQEWGSLSKKTRREYIEAVKCLRKKPAISPKSYAPGARTRFDDFQATHIERSPWIHVNGPFFPFHRYYVHLYERALRDECGYMGAQPSWDWTLNYKDQRQSTVLDGSPYSMGSNGVVIPNRGPFNATLLNGELLTIQPGTGGGCIATGPFANVVQNLGPGGRFAFEPQPPFGPDYGLGYNPRCVLRDISLNPDGVSPMQVVREFTEGGDSFERYADLVEFGTHFGGHFALGGVQTDVWASPGDPVFYLHHTQMDRLWTIWQAQNLKVRQNQVYGTETAFNKPPSPDATLDLSISFGAVAANRTIRELVSTIDGPFCYIYT